MRSTLFVVDGPSASGKTSLQRYVEEVFPEIETVNKYSDRSPEDKAAAGFGLTEQHPISVQEFDAKIRQPGFIWYEFAGYRYGFKFDQIEERLSASSVFIIVRDLLVIARLKDFGADRNIKVSSIYIDSSDELRRGYLEEKGYSSVEILARLSRGVSLYPRIRRHCSVYDHIIENQHDIEALYAQFDRIYLDSKTGSNSPVQRIPPKDTV